MSYATGAITSSADARANLITAITDAMTTHAAWEYVETITTTGGGNVSWQVWKNLGTENAFGTDFFIGIGYLTTSNNNVLYFFCSEGYDSTDNTTIRPCAHGNLVAATGADASYGNGTEYAPNINSTDVAVKQVSTNNTSTVYYLHLSDERMILGTRTAADDGLYIGLFESFVASDPFPLMLAGFDGSTTSGTNFDGYGHTWSRHPGRVSQSADNDHFKGCPLLVTAAVGWAYPGWTFLAGRVDEFWDGFFDQALVARHVVAQATSFGSGPCTANGRDFGVLRGLLYDCYVAFIDSAVAMGDTVTLAGNSYTCVGRSQAGSGEDCGLFVRNT